MTRPIGLGAPIIALFCFALLYNEHITPYLPKGGWSSVITSPQVFFFLAIAVIVVLRKLRLSDIGLQPTRLGHRVGLGFAVGLIPALLTIVIGLLLIGVDRVYPFLSRPILGGNPLPIRFEAAGLVTLLILAPISEEIFFRGILLRALREKYSVSFAIAISSIIFMGGHGLFAVGPLLMGVITALMTLRTGSVFPGMVFHFMSNAYGPLLVIYFPNLYRYLDFFFQ